MKVYLVTRADSDLTNPETGDIAVICRNREAADDFVVTDPGASPLKVVVANLTVVGVAQVAEAQA